MSSCGASVQLVIVLAVRGQLLSDKKVVSDTTLGTDSSMFTLP